MEKPPTCFFAYASQLPTVSEVIEECIKKINDGQTVVMNSWKTANVSGKFIMQEICEEIDKNDFFACDITCLNPNVLFELGYAIARKKRVWISRDTSIDESNKDYTRLKLLTTVGYAPYTNCEGLIKAFYNARPCDDLDSTIYKTIIEPITKDKKDLRLLYSKSLHETEASVRMTRRINKSIIPLIIDDPTEVQAQTFNWYIENIFFSFGVLVHLVAHTRQGWQLHNAKLALVSGLTYGFGKHLLMLVEEPYESPIDYRDLLRSYKTAKLCENYVTEWLFDIEPKYEKKRSEFEDYREERKRQIELTNIYLGEYVAENESDQISNYFVSTAPYLEALRAQQTIFVGRKGTGKTANLYKIVDELNYDKRNHVCVIKPVAYELEGLTKMLQQSLPKSEQGYLIESFWKFLIYTEIAKSVIDTLKTKPPYYENSIAEKKLCDFVQKYSDLIENEFSIRLEQVVTSLCNINSATSAAGQRTRISEILHSKIIGELRILLGEVLEKNNRIVILIDNLDKTWKKRDDLPDLCKLCQFPASLNRFPSIIEPGHSVLYPSLYEYYIRFLHNVHLLLLSFLYWPSLFSYRFPFHKHLVGTMCKSVHR